MSFKVGQKVVYPNHGVTVVEDIASTVIDGAERTCYHLRLLSSNSKVMVPKDNLDLVGLRPLCEIKEIRNVLGILENGSFDAQKDWKGRYKQNVEKMKTGRITEVAADLRRAPVQCFVRGAISMAREWLADAKDVRGTDKADSNGRS